MNLCQWQTCNRFRVWCAPAEAMGCLVVVSLVVVAVVVASLLVVVVVAVGVVVVSVVVGCKRRCSRTRSSFKCCVNSKLVIVSRVFPA